MDAQHLGISESEYVGYIENEYIIVDEKYWFLGLDDKILWTSIK